MAARRARNERSRRLLFGVAWLAMWAFVGAAALAADAPKGAACSPEASNRAAWMARGTYGVMTHYLVTPKGNTPAERTADLNQTVDHFDLDGFMRQFEETRADWLIFTLGQTTDYLCSPNAYLDAKRPGHTPRRDLAMEIAQRLHRLGKRLILYFPSDPDPTIQRLLDCDPKRCTELYFEFLRQYSLKFGKLHHGWWFDACSPHPDEYWKKYLAAVRAGNPDAAVAFSGAEFCAREQSVEPICKLADYHAGEIHLLEDGKIRRDFLYPPGTILLTADGKLRRAGREAKFYLPDGPKVGGIQWHGLLPIELTFNPAIPNQFCHYTDKELFEFVHRVKAVGGAITINVPIDVTNGHIRDDAHSQLVRLSKTLVK